ncbi:MAG: hypothetical protein U1E27_09865 [Kiritimatiellia bacterium]|nr:hypothetical protein [Kiritimatiellia bacterium]
MTPRSILHIDMDAFFDLAEIQPSESPAPPRRKREAISRTLDQIRARYGPRSVRRGSSLGPTRE